jgi:hypothetical protein
VHSKPLDYETRYSYVFRVLALEAQLVKDSVTVNVSVLNVNDGDPQFKYPAYEFLVGEEAADLQQGNKIGEVQVQLKFTVPSGGRLLTSSWEIKLARSRYRYSTNS